MNFYVYAYLRKSNNTPYYIGKGKDNRAYSTRNRRVSVPKDKTKIVFYQTYLNENDAFILEQKYIKLFGRKDNRTGILLNLTDGGEGTSGIIPSEEHRRKNGIAHKGIPKGPQSEKHKINNSLAHKGQKAWNKGIKTGPVSEETRKKHTLARTGQKRGKYTLHKEPHGTKHLQGKKASCLCCKREFDLGNLAKHLRKKENESTI
jgi:hypothetical protein